jgi:hypothetical protein
MEVVDFPYLLTRAWASPPNQGRCRGRTVPPSR